MTKQLKRDLKRYYKTVTCELVCSGRERKIITAEIRESLFEFAETYSVENMDWIYRHFGQPEDFAAKINSSRDAHRIRRYFLHRRIAIIGILVLLVIISVGIFACNYISDNVKPNQYTMANDGTLIPYQEAHIDIMTSYICEVFSVQKF
jgi:hypothetical protein